MAKLPVDLSRKQKIDKVIQDMSDGLRQQYDKLFKLWENRTNAELTKHHAIGQRVAAIDDDERTYGKRAVAQLAQALQLNRATLYDYAAVARCWPAAEITKVRDRKGFMGRSLSWSHLVELSRVEKKSTREKLFVQALDEGLKVRELARRVKEHLPSETSDPLPAGKAVLKDLQKMADDWELLLKESREQTPKLCERLKSLDPLELADAHLVVLKRLIETLKKLKTFSEDHQLMLWESKENVYAGVNPAAAGDSNETKGAAPSDEKSPEHEKPAPAGNNGKAPPATRNGRKPKGRQAEAPETAAPA